MNTSFSSGFLKLEYLKNSAVYYKKFTDQDSGLLEDFNDEGECVASLDYIVKDFYLEEANGPVKFIIITNMKSDESRQAFVSWSDKLLSQVMEIKEKTKASYVLFLLSRHVQNRFKGFILPRRNKRDQLRFNHIRSLDIQMIQGRGFLADKPLKHVHVRRAVPSDVSAISGYIKRASTEMAIKRVVGEEELQKEMSLLGSSDFSNIAVAESHEQKIVGLLGVFNPMEHLKTCLDLDEVKDSIFFVTQSFLKFGSIFSKKIRPVESSKNLNFRFFSHIYCNNKDIFYSLMCWWLDQTQKEKPVFIYPQYKGELKLTPSPSIFYSNFPADLYLMQKPDAPPSPLLKPNYFTPHIDIDLHSIF